MINRLLTEYRKTRSQWVFTDLHQALHRRWDYKIPQLASRYGLDIHDVYEAHDQALLDIVESESVNENNFEGCLHIKIKKVLIDIVRKNDAKKRGREREVLECTLHYDEELDEPEFQFKDDTSDGTEYMALCNIQKEREQPMLLSILFANTDDFTTQIRHAAKNLDEVNANSLGKAINAKYEKVDRRFKRLRVKFNSLGYGNIHDYFTA
ncbi:hypothetical protein [Aneurinibacillus aneurinilyticus]|jgi:hypothetical protein|uniref:hypothetical protein n=1 Tax=Aneurinibacillus aneurinilyticus TaxID=1391 RepID=UPI0036726849